ncbi:hypothetical protein ABZV58_16485 [Nocardia sp. NPDC004654]|uniref:hypothetical protein n=1 Tax=Nocardia sp. NPDC004654 TaxID=3154776 RepID=UPI0033B10F8A
MPIQGIRRIPDMMILLAEWQPEVSLTELRRAVDLLLNHLEAVAAGDTIRLDEGLLLRSNTQPANAANLPGFCAPK